MVKRKFIEICNKLNDKSNTPNKKLKKNIFFDITNILYKLNIIESRIILFPN